MRARPTCPKHETDTGENCRTCMLRRLWDEEHHALSAIGELDEARRRRELREHCPRCEGTNTYLDDNGNAQICRPHQEDQDRHA